MLQGRKYEAEYSMIGSESDIIFCCSEPKKSPRINEVQGLLLPGYLVPWMFSKGVPVGGAVLLCLSQRQFHTFKLCFFVPLCVCRIKTNRPVPRNNVNQTIGKDCNFQDCSCTFSATLIMDVLRVSPLVFYFFPYCCGLLNTVIVTQLSGGNGGGIHSHVQCP